MIGSPLELKATRARRSVALGNIFTHVDFDELQSILKKASTRSFRVAAKSSFQFFLADTYRLEDEGIYGAKELLQPGVVYPESSLSASAMQNDWFIVEYGLFCRTRGERAPHFRVDGNKVCLTVPIDRLSRELDDGLRHALAIRLLRPTIQTGMQR